MGCQLQSQPPRSEQSKLESSAESVGSTLFLGLEVLSVVPVSITGARTRSPSSMLQTLGPGCGCRVPKRGRKELKQNAWPGRPRKRFAAASRWQLAPLTNTCRSRSGKQRNKPPGSCNETTRWTWQETYPCSDSRLRFSKPGATQRRCEGHIFSWLALDFTQRVRIGALEGVAHPGTSAAALFSFAVCFWSHFLRPQILPLGGGAAQ